MPESLQHRFPSPLRYPGGKGKVSNYMKLMFLENGLIGHDYVEPFAGGASVALSLLFEEYASHVHINDINRSVYAFWDAVLTQTEQLSQRILDTAVTKDEWDRQKAVQASETPDSLDLAFSTFFLNRSGIIEGGIIGGKDQDGPWKLDARYNKADLILRIQKIARYSSRITLTRLDAAEYLRTVLPDLPATTFVYLDPPYYVKGQGLYEHFYGDEDHAEIAGLARNLDQPWLVSYDAAPRVLELYAGLEQITYGLCYSAQDRYRGAEVMVFAPRLTRPDVDSPANIPASTVDAEKLAVLFAA
jgi:DNA adenine methylase